MNFRKSNRHLLILLSAILFSAASLFACPDCALKNSGGIIEPQTVTAKLAFSTSTLIMLGIFFSVLGVLVWSMVKACRDLNLHTIHNLNKELPLSSNKGV